MTTQVDPRFFYQHPDHVSWLRDFARLIPGLHYYVANDSEYCLTFEANIVDDPRPLFQWIQAHGGLPIIDPKRHYWEGKGVFWFPNPRSRWYAIHTAGEYLIRDWWWKHTFDFDCEEA